MTCCTDTGEPCQRVYVNRETPVATCMGRQLHKEGWTDVRRDANIALTAARQSSQYTAHSFEIHNLHSVSRQPETCKQEANRVTSLLARQIQV